MKAYIATVWKAGGCHLVGHPCKTKENVRHHLPPHMVLFNSENPSEVTCAECIATGPHWNGKNSDAVEDYKEAARKWHTAGDDEERQRMAAEFDTAVTNLANVLRAPFAGAVFVVNRENPTITEAVGNLETAARAVVACAEKIDAFIRALPEDSAAPIEVPK